MRENKMNVDILILLWLIATWVYEGHYKRHKVEWVCPRCGKIKTDARQVDVGGDP